MTAVSEMGLHPSSLGLSPDNFGETFHLYVEEEDVRYFYSF